MQLIQELLANRTELNLQGIAVSIVDAAALQPLIEQAMTDYNIPIITFDSDAPDSSRVAYVGTDNYFFGTQLAKVLKQVHPLPGRFAIVSATPPNIQEREQGVRDHLVKEGWEEVASSPSDMNSNSTTVVDQMFAFAETYPDLTAIVPVMGAGMRAPDNYWTDFVKAHPEVLLVVGDAMPNQLELLDRQQCHGLVGQLPYEMGVLSLQTLHQLYTTDNMLTTDQFIGTNVLEHLLIPLKLPYNDVNHNLVGELRYVGYVLFALVAAMALAFSMWTYVNRNARVIKVAQPVFLVLLATGALIMSSAVLPLGFDDTTHSMTEQHGIAVCMSPFWLLAFGFSLTFSSLFAKIYRVNLLFESANRFSRVKSSGLEAILIPLLGLTVANGVILTCWTVLDPLRYVRLEHSGTDGWDRAISTYGTCQGDNSLAYLIPLTIVNGIMLIFANWTAYKARGIDEEFAESKYVGMAMMSMLQASLSGIPILMVVRESPQAYYMVQVFMIFIICSAILLLIFVPKMVLFQQFKSQPAAAQQARIQQSILRSSLGMRKSVGFSGDESSKFSAEQVQTPPSTVQKTSLESSTPEQAPTSDLDIQDIDNFGNEDEVPLAPMKPFKKPVDVLRDRSSWGAQTVSTVMRNDDGDDDEHPPAPKQAFNKPVDVLKGTTSWGVGTLSAILPNDDESDSENGYEH